MGAPQGRQERRRNEKALQETEKKFFTVFQHSPVPMAIASIEEGRLFDVNEQYTRLIEFSQEELVGHTVAELNLWVDPEERIKYIRSINKNHGEIQSYPVSLRTKSGRVVEVLFSADIIKINNAPYLLTSIVDITERKLAEYRLSESEKLYRMLFNAIDEGFCIIEVIFDENEKPIDYRFLEINPSFEKQTGLSGAQGKRMRELAPKHEEYWFEIYGKIASTGQPARFVNHAGQLHRWYDVYAFRLGQPENRQVAVLFNDITKRKQAEEELARSEERYRSLATTADLMYLADREGRCLFLNDGYMKRIGLPKEQIIGRFYSDFHDEEATRMFMDSVQKVFDTEDVYQREHTSTRDGKIFLITYSPVKDSLGQTRAVTIVSKDITERKKAENALRASREQLRAFAGRLQATREEERTQIAREIHDELGGALTAMKIDSSLLARTVAKVRDKALQNSLQARINETTNLIDATMRTMRRIATGLRPGILDDLGLVAALEWQLTDFQKRTGVRCEFTPSADCADLDQNRATALFRMAQEALTNVARHAQATEVRVRLQENAGTILLEVEDNGVGIKAEEIRNTKSLGILGMRERALAFGGRVTITGRPGEGTTVAVESPPAGRGVQDREGDE